MAEVPGWLTETQVWGEAASRGPWDGLVKNARNSWKGLGATAHVVTNHIWRERETSLWNLRWETMRKGLAASTSRGTKGVQSKGV